MIATNARTCDGGTLVLSNSYDQINGLVANIKKHHPDVYPRLVPQVRNAKFAVTRAAFVEAHANGVKPILLGLGPAWTGLNLSMENTPASKDTLVTDLVIACSPIGLNRSSTMLHRIALTNTGAISKEALLILKQGLGRLIRRDKLQGRRIWILDGRIWSENWLPQFTGPAKRLLAKYKNVKYF